MRYRVSKPTNVVSDVEYTGLTDTAVAYSGSSTLDTSVDPGSPLPIGQTSTSTPLSTYDLWEHNSPAAALAFSGVTDPPFQSAQQSTPRPHAAAPAGAMFNAFHGQAKYGSAIATLLGNHPQHVGSSPSKLPASGKVLSHQIIPSGSQVAIFVIIVVGVIILLLNGD